MNPGNDKIARIKYVTSYSVWGRYASVAHTSHLQMQTWTWTAIKDKFAEWFH